MNERTVHTVSELAEILRALVEDSLPRLWVEGEISNFSRPASGHWYFTLKDANAQIRCAMFRNTNYLIRPQPANGDKVLLRAQVSFYTARGDLQLIAEHLEPAGSGALLRAFEELKRRLLAEGLFDAAHKRPIPALPRRVGLITSSTGAAVQDVLAAIARRFPLLCVDLWPVPVQGEAAVPAIVKALQHLPARAPVDAILLVRGGGSLEDLWAFNEERVARAIRACAVPVVTGIGHETDTTIADFAADLRAPTPTAAAELLSPDRSVFAQRIDALAAAAARALTRGLRSSRERLEQLQARLARLHPQRTLDLRAQRLDECEQRLREALLRGLRTRRAQVAGLGAQVAARSPAQRVLAEQANLQQQLRRLRAAALAGLRTRRASCDQASAVLASLSPQAVLERGYAIARSDGGVLRSPDQLTSEQEFELLLARGTLRASKIG